MKRDRRGRFLAAAGGSGAAPEPRPRPGAAAPDSESAAARPEPPAGWAPAAAWARPGGAAEAGIGRALSTGYCRLCHGKFSSRSLRNAFGKVPVMGENSEKQRRVDQVFFTDFQRLVGVAVRQDPLLPQFVCKKCHAQFYKCRSVLRTFIQRVNASPAGLLKSKGKSGAVQAQPGTEGGASCLVDLITSSPQCLHSLVTWTHTHAGSCASVPSLQSVLSSEYCGIIHAVWGCGNGHDYVMDTDSDCSTVLVDNALSAKQEWNKSTAQHLTDNGAGTDNAEAVSTPKPQHSPVRTTPCQQPTNKGTTSVPLDMENEPMQNRDSSHSQSDSTASSQEKALLQPESPFSGATGELSEKQVLSATSDERVKDEFSDLSEGDFLSDDENEKRNVQSSDDSFEPFPKKKASSKKSDGKEVKKAEEPKIRKKTVPKPGWKKKIKCEREELPTIYKCPYQGCTAVYRGADGMKKHIKEHHEEVRERPCPHPGCNKVFMIDRYLQRHVKLIHTEVRNYICDECGQTFKQRKHLSVHQMRHSGAKPLQDFLSDDENEKRNVQSSDDSFEPFPKKKASSKKSGGKKGKKAEEPKIRKKPGPKPGWKKKIKCEREELPTIYKCPYQGCTAVYRGADGMKKHIKEHHEEVRERPCPHPGCNKVFMIDRYLQRHVKLIHTEVRNYICDECGQTFKQRKHLLVHQMRHSGAKPLQCEICGFQCRQRASLKYHMTKHKAETELEFACDQCGKRFEKAHNLNVHMSMVHPLTQTQDKAKALEPEPILLLNTSGTSESQAVKPEVTAQQEPT